MLRIGKFLFVNLLLAGILISAMLVGVYATSSTVQSFIDLIKDENERDNGILTFILIAVDDSPLIPILAAICLILYYAIFCLDQASKRNTPCLMITKIVIYIFLLQVSVKKLKI